VLLTRPELPSPGGETRHSTDHTPGLNAAAPVCHSSLTVSPAAASTVVLLAYASRKTIHRWYAFSV